MHASGSLELTELVLDLPDVPAVAPVLVALAGPGPRAVGQPADNAERDAIRAPDADGRHLARLDGHSHRRRPISLRRRRWCPGSPGTRGSVPYQRWWRPARAGPAPAGPGRRGGCRQAEW